MAFSPWCFWELESKEKADVTAHQGNHTVVLFPTALFAYIFWRVERHP
jgi:hypothetical protein